MTRHRKIALVSVALAAAVAFTLTMGWASLEYAAGRDPFAELGLAFATTDESLAVVDATPSGSSGTRELPEASRVTEGQEESVTQTFPADESSRQVHQTADDTIDEPPEVAPDSYEVIPEAQPEPSTDSVSLPVERNVCDVSVVIDASAVGGGTYGDIVSVPTGASAYDALAALGVGINARPTAFGMYVAAIDGVAEKEHGSMSGWVYDVNGSEPPVAASAYELSDGDAITWTYVNVDY